MNHTINDKIRCMFSYAKLPKFFLGVMRIVVDLINLLPSNPLNCDVLENVWIGKNVSYDFLWVFGYWEFVHVLKIGQYIFLGYVHEEFGYGCWDPIDKKVIRSRDVFFEDQTIEDFEKLEKPKFVNNEEIVDWSPILSMVQIDDKRDT